MKTKYYYLITVMFAVFSFCSLKAEQRDVKILKDIEDESEVIHRAPAQIPITCVLEDDSYLVVTFLADLGTVSVEIENLTTGEYSLSPVNALPGPMIFPISGSVGNWRISFTLPSGVRYSGEFEII